MWSRCIPLLCLLLLIPRELQAQFPRPCTTQEAVKKRECCPVWKGSPCGFASGRGVCAPHPARDLPKPTDYRENWPRVFYDSVCTCWGNFDGFDCGQCLPGWKGPLCTQRHHVERKEITELTSVERDTFLSNLHKAKRSVSDRYMILISEDTSVEDNYVFQNTSVYNLYAWIHYYSAKSYAGSMANAAHMGPAFAFWHRVFLLFIEREIQELTGEQDFHIPYWDWTRTDHCNICTNRYLGGVGPDGHIDSSSAFSKWETICPFQQSLGIICVDSVNHSSPAYLTRNPGKDPAFPTLPTAEDVRQVMTTDQFDTPPYDKTSTNSFRNKLEGFDVPKDSRHLTFSMHNLVHAYLNGTMTRVPTAANDPIFMVHHAFIDKLVDDWLKNHSEASYPNSDQVPPPQRVQAYMAPFFPLRTNGFYVGRTTQSLGYGYNEPSVHPRAEDRTRGAVDVSAPRGNQWQWSFLGILGVVLLCISVLAAVRYSGSGMSLGKQDATSDITTEDNKILDTWVCSWSSGPTPYMISGPLREAKDHQPAPPAPQRIQRIMHDILTPSSLSSLSSQWFKHGNETRSSQTGSSHHRQEAHSTQTGSSQHPVDVEIDIIIK